MTKPKDRFRAGDKVDEAAEYVCDLCHTEGGTDAQRLKKGSRFPVCMNCGSATSWRKAPAK